MQTPLIAIAQMSRNSPLQIFAQGRERKERQKREGKRGERRKEAEGIFIKRVINNK